MSDKKYATINEICTYCCSFAAQVDTVMFGSMLHTMIDEHCKARGVDKSAVLDILGIHPTVMTDDEIDKYYKESEKWEI